MKTEAQTLVKYLKRLNLEQEIIQSSVSFKSVQSNEVAKPKNIKKDIFMHMEDALNSGDNTIWRMWR